jgi:hypothetical protein
MIRSSRLGDGMKNKLVLWGMYSHDEGDLLF